MDRLRLLVEVDELLEQRGVDLAGGRVGLVGGLDRRPCRGCRRACRWPRASSVRRPAPRTLASTGSAIWRMVRPVASACIWDHRSELAPPPTKASESKRRLQYFSTAPSSQAEFSATPSKTARTMSARVEESEMLWKPPRMVWSSTGERSPLSQGVNRTPWEPAGTEAATSLRRAEEVRRAAAPAGGGQGVVGKEHVVAQPGEAGAPRLVLVGHQVAAGDARGDGRDVGQRRRSS